MKESKKRLFMPETQTEKGSYWSMKSWTTVKSAKAKKESTQRLLISDLNLPAVKRALKQMRSNRDFVPLSVSALARSRADWLYGMNMSRAYTLLGQKKQVIKASCRLDGYKLRCLV
ncbi:hypothetical protein QW180_15120 [Vibrio sinaloensis]|nr:hypothetical protein [Vibrio sinaloensis]